jgi:putative ABC transport system permease protein
MRLVARHGLLLILAGTGLGVAGTVALHRAIARFLYGTTAADPSTFAAVLTLFAAVAACSTFIPARRATRVDPMVTFRAE